METEFIRSLQRAFLKKAPYIVVGLSKTYLVLILVTFRKLELKYLRHKS